LHDTVFVIIARKLMIAIWFITLNFCLDRNDSFIFWHVFFPRNCKLRLTLVVVLIQITHIISWCLYAEEGRRRSWASGAFL